MVFISYEYKKTKIGRFIFINNRQNNVNINYLSAIHIMPLKYFYASVLWAEVYGNRYARGL
jgi:hypothetical protein